MMNIKSQVQLRKAKPLDSKSILDLVKELALFEKAPDQVKTTESEYSDGLHSSLFQVILAEHPTLGILGMALYFPYFSTWGGKTMYLEDFIIKEEYRRYGLGSLLFEAFIQDAKNQGARKLKWQVLDWNHTAKSFYIKFNAQIISGWENGVIEF
ncbi:MAG: GNAT family N-acetyltransferase [Saprospiraceae bacterium]